MDHDETAERQNTDLSQIIQRLLIDSILFECCLAVFDYIVHDALVHGTLW